MANSDALRARATFLYELAERVTDWDERLKLHSRARTLEDYAKQIECSGIPEIPITSQVMISDDNPPNTRS